MKEDSGAASYADIKKEGNQVMNAVVIIPVYQPETCLKKLVVDLWNKGNQVILVDDGSDKDKQEEFSQLSEYAIVLHHKQNRGKGAAIKTALKYIQENLWDYDIIGVMDGDGQHQVTDMERLILKARSCGRSLILGMRQISEKMPPRSRFGNTITSSIFQFMTGTVVSDTQSGLRAFSREMNREFYEVSGERYEYETNVLLYCAKHEIPIVEVPIETIYQDKANRTSHFRILQDSFRIYKELLKEKVPWRFSKFTGISLSSFLLDYVMFALLMIFLPHTTAMVLAGNIVARLISAYYNYSMNCKYVFHRKKTFYTGLFYFALAGFILVINNLILEGFIFVLHLPIHPAKFLTECMLFLISWFVQNKVIFGQKKFFALRTAKEVKNGIMAAHWTK